MGKGGCLLGFATMGINAIRQFIGCLCCICITGPILLLVGVVMLVGPNNRAANVLTYNTAVTTYTSDIIPKLQSGNATAGGYSMSLQNEAVTVKGNLDDVSTSGQSYYFYRSSLSFGTSNSVNVRIGSSSYTFQQSSLSTSSTKSTTVRCSDRNGCTDSEMRSKCRSESGCSSAYLSGSTSQCRYSTCTVTCRYTAYLQDVCRVVKVNPTTGLVTSSTKTYCTYPFTSAHYSCSGSTSTSLNRPLQVKTDNDPSVILSELTKGKDDFGLTEAQQRLMGLGLMVVGLAFIGCLVGLCCAARSLCSNHEHKAAVYGAFGRQYQYPAGYQAPGMAQPMMQQPVMQPQQPMMVSPQSPGGYQPVLAAASPGYAPQPQPGYAPQPVHPGGYAPQPGYAQPQPGYGQPQPGLL